MAAALKEIDLSKSLAVIKSAIPAELAKLAKLPRPTKITALSLGLGVALFGALAVFFKRRRRRAQMNQKKLDAKKQHRQQHMSHSRNLPSTQTARLQFQSSNQSSTSGNRSTLSSRRLKNPRFPNGGEFCSLLVSFQ